MRFRRNGSDYGYPLPGSTGWLFADLMLALVVVMVALVAQLPPAPPPQARPAPTTPPLTSSTPPPRERLAVEPIKFDVLVDGDGLLASNPAAITAAQEATRPQLAALGNRRAGLALTFGWSETRDIQHGVDIARKFNEVVLGNMGPQFVDCRYRDYFQGKPPHTVTVEIFYFER